MRRPEAFATAPCPGCVRELGACTCSAAELERLMRGLELEALHALERWGVALERARHARRHLALKTEDAAARRLRRRQHERRRARLRDYWRTKRPA